MHYSPTHIKGLRPLSLRLLCFYFLFVVYMYVVKGRFYMVRFNYLHWNETPTTVHVKQNQTSTMLYHGMFPNKHLTTIYGFYFPKRVKKMGSHTRTRTHTNNTTTTTITTTT